MHVTRESASDVEGVVRRWLSTSREEHIGARSNTTGHQFYASAKTMVQKRSLALAASAVAPSPSPRSLAERFLLCVGIYTVAANPGSSR